MASPALLHDFADVVGRTESCISSIHARLAPGRASAQPEPRSLEELESDEALEKQLEVLRTLLDKLRALSSEYACR